MKNLLFVLITTITFNLSSFAQVGIGQTPKSGSILDLSNSNNKYLILPVPNTDPASIMTDSAAVLYYKGNIYLKTTTGIKVFTPWDWDGSNTGAVSSPAGSSVGIGVVPAVPNFKFQVADAGEIESASAGNASIIVGAPTSNHLLIDNNEIMAKTNPNTAGVLKLQEESGTVEIRMDTLTSTKTVLKVNGSIDAAGSGSVRENGFDLVPSGTVVMWYGPISALGYPVMDGVENTNWHICDGSPGTPDLRERFIVGAGGDNPTVAGTSGYALNADGGENTVALTESEMPSHDHSGSTGAGTHKHDYDDQHQSSGNQDHICALGCGSNVPNTTAAYTARTTHDDGSHTHTISSQGLGSAHENRPPYYALAYIIKL